VHWLVEPLALKPNCNSLVISLLEKNVITALSNSLPYNELNQYQ